MEISGLYMDCVKVRDAGGELRPTANISSRTLDCFMLAARLAIARKTRRDKPGLLVLDEPFSAIDASRLGAALELLKDFHAHRLAGDPPHQRRGPGGQHLCFVPGGSG